MLKALNAYVELQDNGCFNKDAVTAKFEDSMAAVLSGKAAFVAQHSNMLETLDAAAGGDPAKVDASVGFIPLSMTSPYTWFSASPLGTYYLPITGDSVREEAALGFVRYITGEGYTQYVQDSKAPPALSGFDVPKLRPLLIDINNAYAKASPGIDILGGGIGNQMSRLLSKQTDPKGAADQIEITIEQQSKAAGLPGW